MRRRNNPWPAYVDLFAALLIATLGGLSMLAAKYREVDENAERVSDLRRKTGEIAGKLQRVLADDGSVNSKIHPCGDDTCIDLYIHFKPNDDAIESQHEQASIAAFAAHLKRAIDEQFSIDERRTIEVFVEGHTDSTQVKNHAANPRSAYLFNWHLSSRRAASVLYEFADIGLRVPDYNIVAIGYADSDPRCPPRKDRCNSSECEKQQEECNATNRRTTLRLRVDSRKIADMLHVRNRLPADPLRRTEQALIGTPSRSDAASR